MFDDPKRNLRRMEAELKAAEFAQDPMEDLDLDLENLFGDKIEADDWLDDAKALLGEEKPEPLRPRRGAVPNDAVDFHRTVFADEGGETAAVYVEKKNRKRWKEEKRRGPGCLPLLMILELMGIGILAWWWMQWLS